MDTEEERFQKLVSDEIGKSFEGKKFQAERLLGLPSDALRTVLKGNRKAGTSLNRVRQICDALGFELYIGPPRDIVPASFPDLEADFAVIANDGVEAAAGAGSTAEISSDAPGLAFRRSFLARLGVAPSRACLVRAKGDSMYPTIQDGDMMLVDLRRTELPPEPGRTAAAGRGRHIIYVYRFDDALRVKILQRIPGGHVLVSSADPALNPPEIIAAPDTADLVILGRVVWWGHTAA